LVLGFEESNIFHPTPKWGRRFPRTTQRRKNSIGYDY